MTKTQWLALLACGVSAGSLGGTPAFAQTPATIVQQRNAETQKLIPLNKLTVGPDDQYDASSDPSGRYLVFTHKADLVAHLQVQDLQTGDVTDLLPLNADSQEASFNPDGRLAFTFFQFNARGDVCYARPSLSPVKTLEERDITCLNRSAKSSNSQRSSPFWKSANEIGYLERDLGAQTSRVVIENIETGKQTIVAGGPIWSPSMKFGGKYVVFNELIQEKGETLRRLVVRDLASEKNTVVHLSLPGISGFPSVSEDETQVYFSHFLNDTNNDRAIDGGDNAVVFRIPIAQVLSAAPGTELFPEQLTSVESSCSFPRPSGDRVFVTCAFEGSLDSYQMPATGIVPPSWDEKLITNAIQTSRSYQDRILLLNTLKFRTKHAGPSFDERLLVNHIYSDDTIAARYYLSSVVKSAPTRDKSFFQLVGLYLDGRELKKAQPSEEISREFQKQILALDQKASKIGGEPKFSAIVRGLLRTFINDQRQAQSFFKQVRADSKARPMELYFFFELANNVLRSESPSNLGPLLSVYQRMMSAPELSEESQMYYAVLFLKQARIAEPERMKRVELINRVNKGLPAPIATLLGSEVVTLRLIEAKDDKAKVDVYQELDGLMAKTRSDYFLRKALYVRAILNFADAAEFKFLALVASNWLRYTSRGDTEFAYAREVFADSSLDRAYDSWAEKNYNFASSFFYESLSLTDDLESHSGYIKTMVQKGQRSVIADRYKNLRDRQFINDNMKFVDALLILIDNEAKASSNDSYVSHLDQAIEKLTSMEQDRDSAVRHLLLGYCYMEKLLRTSKGLEFDGDLFQKAHRSLMLAHDLGRDNNRVKASAMMDLGILHARVQNFGLSARFFTIRKRYGFTSEEERARFEYLYARSLGHSNQPDRAVTELVELPAPLKSTPHLERQAFFAMTSGNFKTAVETYAALLKSGQIKGDANLARVNLSYGYSLLKLNRAEEAKSVLRESLDHAGRLSPIKKGGDQIVDFEPDRMRVIIYGLLGQIGTDSERADALMKRGELLAKSNELIDDVLSKRIQNRLQLADLYSKTDLARSTSFMQEALNLTEEYGEANQYFGNAVFRATSGYLAHALAHPAEFAKADSSTVRKVYDRTIQNYEAQKIQQPMLDYQKLKLQVLWAAFSARVIGQPEAAPRDLDSVMSSSLSQSLKTSLPEMWSNVDQLARAVRVR